MTKYLFICFNNYTLFLLNFVGIWGLRKHHTLLVYSQLVFGKPCGAWHQTQGFILERQVSCHRVKSTALFICMCVCVYFYES